MPSLSTMKPQTSSFVSSSNRQQEVQAQTRTPTISNCAAPTNFPPPLALGGISTNPSQTLCNGDGNSNGNGHRNNYGYIQQQPQTASRRPRFSSPTAKPIIIQRPLQDLRVQPTSFTGFPLQLQQTITTRESKYSKQEEKWDHGLLYPTLTSTVGDFSLVRTNTNSDHGDLLLQIIPLLLACDLFKTDVPRKLLLRTLQRLLIQSAQCLRRGPQFLFGLSDPLAPRSTNATGPNTNVNTSAIDSTAATLRTAQPPPSFTKVTTVQGIPNYGQTCFLNAVLQALASLEPFLAYLERILQLQQESKRSVLIVDTSTSTSASSTADEQQCFPRQVLDILRVINGNPKINKLQRGRQRRNNRVDPRPLLRRIGETNSQFQASHSMMMSEQQDAQELLQALLGVIIADAQLDSTSSCSEHLRFSDYNNTTNHPRHSQDQYCYESDDETMTAVFARGDENIDWSPTSSVQYWNNNNSNNSKNNGPFSGDSVISLSCLLQRLDESLKLQKQDISRKREAQSKPVVNEDEADPLHQREEKKQEDFEISVAFSSSSEENVVDLGRQFSNGGKVMHHQQRMEDSTIESTITDSSTLDDQSLTRELSSSPLPPNKLSMSMQIMKSTISSITPSPLSGWLGSTLRCCNCTHVRPIQNAPFLDIPLTPTSVGSYLANAHNPSKSRPAPNVSPMPACSLDQCMADFTSVERVSDVECRSCSMQKEIMALEEEAMMLRGAIASTEKRIKQKGGDPSDKIKCLQEDLFKVEMRLIKRQTMDPDEEDFTLDGLDKDELLGMTGTETTENKQPLDRCDAKKCLLLTRCPSILCCHIQRRYYDHTTNRMEKCVQYVEFPEILDLGPYCAYGPRARTPWAAGSSKQPCMSSDVGGKVPYRLQSIIEHRGNAHGGHYVSYRRDQSGEWFRISDSNVTPIPWRQVRTCQAYMLFYEAV